MVRARASVKAGSHSRGSRNGRQRWWTPYSKSNLNVQGKCPMCSQVQPAQTATRKYMLRDSRKTRCTMWRTYTHPHARSCACHTCTQFKFVRAEYGMATISSSSSSLQARARTPLAVQPALAESLMSRCFPVGSGCVFFGDLCCQLFWGSVQFLNALRFSTVEKRRWGSAGCRAQSASMSGERWRDGAGSFATSVSGH
jgi:hypothetical protein